MHAAGALSFQDKSSSIPWHGWLCTMLYVVAAMPIVVVRLPSPLTRLLRHTSSSSSLPLPLSRPPQPPRWPSGKASASRAEVPGFESHLRRDFFGASHTSDLKIGTPVATLPGVWRYRVSAGTGRPVVSIL